MTTQHIPDTAAGPAPSPAPGYPPDVEADLLADIGRITSRYPQGHERSALIPMLHLIQSVDGCVSPRGIALCARALGLTCSEMNAKRLAIPYARCRGKRCAHVSPLK